MEGEEKGEKRTARRRRRKQEETIEYGEKKKKSGLPTTPLENYQNAFIHTHNTKYFMPNLVILYFLISFLFSLFNPLC